MNKRGVEPISEVRERAGTNDCMQFTKQIYKN